MALVQVVVGNKVAAEDVNQIIKGLTGSSAHAFLLNGSYGSSAWPLIIWNTHSDGLLSYMRTNAGVMFRVTKDGVRLSPDGAQFDLIPLTTAASQSITNKSISGVLNTITALPTTSYADLSVTEPKLGDLSVSSRALGNDSVSGAKLGLQESVFSYRSSNYALADNVETSIPFNAERWDTNTMHDNSSNSERLVCKVAGLYDVYMGIFIDHDSNRLDDFGVGLKKNGSAFQTIHVDLDVPASSEPTGAIWTYPIRLELNDYLTLAVIQNSNSSKNVTSQSFFGMTRRGA